MNDSKICISCNKPVEENADSYEVFEKMHWLCFHLEFEHSGDPDRACDDVSCPWFHIQILKDKLSTLGYDPQGIIHEAIEKLCNEALQHNK